MDHFNSYQLLESPIVIPKHIFNIGETNSLVCPTRLKKRPSINTIFNTKQHPPHTLFYPHPDNPASFITTSPSFVASHPLVSFSSLLEYRLPERIYKARDFGDYALPTPLDPSTGGVAGVADRTVIALQRRTT